MQQGQLEPVYPGVKRVVAPNPGPMTGPGTNSYVIGESPCAVIDPGPDDDSHLEALCDAVGDRLRWILVTHTHLDHSPLARRLQRATGAEIAGLPLADHAGAGAALLGRMDPHDRTFRADRQLADGDEVQVGEFRLRAIHTPGHASNHLCFELTGSGLLFSGDHVMSGSTVVIAPPDGDMGAYLEALERVRQLGPGVIAPGHGAMIEDAAGTLKHYLIHRRQRDAKVREALAAAGPGGATPDELVPAVYADVSSALFPVARYSLWAHLRMAGAQGWAHSADPGDIAARWKVTSR